MSIVLGPSGCTGGTPFQDSLPNGAVISSIQLWYGDVVNGINMTYSVSGASPQSVMHGTAQGSNQSLTIVPGDYVMSVSGTYAQKITSLTIMTMQGGTITCGSGGDASFHYMVPSTGVFSGFSGRADTQLVAIGIVMNQGQSSGMDQMPCVCMGPAGGTGGQPFIDDPIPPGAQLQSVQVSHGDQVYGIGFTYQVNAATQTVAIHGNGSAGSVDSFVLNPGEFITGISGTFDDTVNTLVIQTNQNRNSPTYGSNAGPVPFSFALTSGCDVVGFVGRADAALDSIGIVGREEGRLPPMTAPVYRFVNGGGAHYYSTSAAGAPAGYTLEGPVFHAFTQQVNDTEPVTRFRLPSSNLYYYSNNATPPQAGPSAGAWVSEGIAWYMFPPLYLLAGVIPLNSYVSGDQWFFAPSSAGDNTSGYQAGPEIGRVFNLPVPIYRFTNGTLHYYSTNAVSCPSGYTMEKVAFFGFGQGVFDTLPVYCYLNRTANSYAYVFRAADLPQPSGSWVYQNIAWYAYPPSAPASGAQALSLYTNGASGDYLYTTNPSSENLNGYTAAGVPAFVFAALGDFAGISIPDRIILCGPDCLYASYSVTEEGEGANEGVSADVHWYGLVLQIDQATLTAIINGTLAVAALTTLIGSALGGVSVSFPPGAPLAVLAGVVAGLLYTITAVLSAVNQGNGVYLTFYWPVFLVPPPLTALPVPSPV